VLLKHNNPVFLRKIQNISKEQLRRESAEEIQPRKQRHDDALGQPRVTAQEIHSWTFRRT
jgi:hypothetical protein